ncbi:MAG: PfkB family carbohydrate kinase [Planctomycetaceae bacterium]
MTPERLQQLLAAFRQQRIVVIGDFFLDKYLEVDPQLAEPSLETGKTAHQVVEIRKSPGAAGTVTNNLAALGAGTLHALGAVGEDGEGFDLCRGLERIGCTTAGILRRDDMYTPTYLKPRDLGVAGLSGEHSRYDTKNRKPLPKAISAELTSKLEKLLPELDAVVIMDQVEMENCGVVSATFRKALNQLAAQNPRKIFWADSRRFIEHYHRMIIKPNQFEAVGNENPAPGDEVPMEELTSAIRRLRAETGATVFVTRGERGMLVSDPEVMMVPGVKVTGPIDPTGAGDSVTAGGVDPGQRRHACRGGARSATWWRRSRCNNWERPAQRHRSR